MLPALVTRRSRLAGRAKAGKVDPVIVDSESGSGLEISQDVVHRATVDVHYLSAAGADEMVVVMIGAAHRVRRTISVLNPTYMAEPGKHLKRAKHSGTAYGVSATLELAD